MARAATVVISHCAARPRAVSAELASVGGRWAFLGSNQHRRRAWLAELAADRELEVGSLLDQCAERLRQPYLDWVEELDQANAGSPGWWFTRISERNSMLDPFFFELCALAAARSLFEEPEPPGLLVAGSWGLADGMAGLAHARGLRVEVRGGARRRLHSMMGLAGAAARLGYFLLDGLQLRSAAIARRLRNRRPRPARSGRPQVLLMTFFGEAQMSADRTFHDAYFPGFAGWLEGRGFETWTYPFFTSRRRLLAKYRWLTAAGQRFLVPEDWLRAGDYLAAARRSLSLLALPRRWDPVDGLDVSDLVRAARYRQAADNGPRLATLVERFPARLAAAGFQPEHVIAWAENQIHDKALFLGCSKAFPGARRTGVHNTPLFPNLTNSFRLPTESRLGVTGDRVVSCGPLPARILAQMSGGQLDVATGCGLRYAYLRESRTQPTFGRPKVVVTLPLLLAEAAGLLEIVLPVCTARTDLDWAFKCHPHYRFERLTAYAGIGQLPTQASIVDGPLGDHIRTAAALVTTGSGTALEAAAFGVPVIVTASRHGLTFDPLAWFETGASLTCHTADDLARGLDACLGPGGPEAARKLGEHVLDGWFAPVSDAALETFLG